MHDYSIQNIHNPLFNPAKETALAMPIVLAANGHEHKQQKSPAFTGLR